MKQLLLYKTLFWLCFFHSLVFSQSNIGSEKSLFETNDNPKLYKTKVIWLENRHIDRDFPAMSGPTKKKVIHLDDNNAPNAFTWIKSVTVDVMGPNKQSQPLALLCHAWVTLKDRSSYSDNQSGLITISEGMGDSLFPKGYGMYIKGSTEPNIELLAQALNEDPHFKMDLSYRFTIKYLSNPTVDKHGPQLLKPLTQVSAVALGPKLQFKDGQLCETELAPGENPNMSNHFLVPPGKHSYRQTLAGSMFQRANTIHFIKLHLHQFGESISFYDRTENKLLWVGKAYYKKGHIDRVDSYSSEVGIPVFLDHQYEIVSTYNNTSKKNAEGMAVLRMYIEK